MSIIVRFRPLTTTTTAHILPIKCHTQHVQVRPKEVYCELLLLLLLCYSHTIPNDKSLTTGTIYINVLNTYHFIVIFPFIQFIFHIIIIRVIMIIIIAHSLIPLQP